MEYNEVKVCLHTLDALWDVIYEKSRITEEDLNSKGSTAIARKVGLLDALECVQELRSSIAKGETVIK